MMGAKAPFTLFKEGSYMRIRKDSRALAILLAMCLVAMSSMIGSGANVYAQSYVYPQGQTYVYHPYVYPRTYYGYPYYRHNPEAGKRKAFKRIGIGAAIGLATGGLIGGGRGALFGGLLGAGGGAYYHFHKKHHYRHHYYYPYYQY